MDRTSLASICCFRTLWILVLYSLPTGCTSFTAVPESPETSAAVREVPFSEAVDISRGEIHGVSSLDVGDINLDGRVDIAVIEGGKHAVGKAFSWYEAPSEEGGEWLRHEFNSAARLRSFLGAARLVDMDSDGDPDLVLSSDNHSGDVRECDLYIFVNPLPDSPATSPWRQVPIEEGLLWHHVNDMEVADMDSDGKPDIIVRSLEPNAVHIFFQDGPYAWTRVSVPTELEQSEGLAVGRLDADPFPDIEFTGFVLRSSDNPRTQPYHRVEIDAEYHRINQNTKDDIGDIDGDGDADVLIAPAERYRNGKPHDLSWYANPGGDLEGTWEKHVVLANTNNTHTAKLADINGDGLLDIYAGVPWDTPSIQIYYNRGAGEFHGGQVLSTVNGLYTGRAVDWDGDGDVDLIGQNTYARNSRPYLYNSLLVDQLAD